MNHIGQQLGNYSVLQLLGRGGFAEVYLGEHRHLGTQVAIKILHGRMTEHEVEGFRREARTIARLTHPSIVRVFDFQVDEGLTYLIMEYAPHGTLRGRHPRGTVLPMPLILSYTQQVADALQYAHDQHVIHRDVKPENMLLGHTQNVLLSDFGIATLAHSSRSQTMQEIAGTASYMAPEQMQGKARPASDQYALAIIVYEWLTGTTPFQGTFMEIASQKLTRDVPPLRAQIPDISQEVEQVMNIALSREPSQRFVTIKAFSEALRQAWQGSFEPTIQGQGVFPNSPSNPGFGGWSNTPGNPGIVPMINPQSNPGIASYPNPSNPSSNPGIIAHPNPYSPASDPGIIRLSGTSDNPANTTLSSPAGFSVDAQGGPSSHTPPIMYGSSSTPDRLGPPSSPGILSGNGQDAQPASVPSAPRRSRRTVVAGLITGLVTIGAAGGGIFLWETHGSSTGHGGSSNREPSQVQKPLGTLVQMYTKHTAYVYAVRWSLDGKRIASAGDDKTVQVWDAQSGNTITTYTGHSSYVYGLSWQPAGILLVSSGADNTAQIWNASNGQQLHVHTESNQVPAVDWSSDGKRILTFGNNKTVEVLDANSANTLMTYAETQSVQVGAWAPDGKRFASGGNANVVHVWDASQNTATNTTTQKPLVMYQGHTNQIRAISWSPDGKYIASGGYDHTVHVWEATSGKLVYTYKGHSYYVNDVAWSHDGKRIASASSDSTVQIWDALSGGHPYTYTGHALYVESARWSPDGQMIASASYDKTVKVWVAR